jgi:hypothetical protein
MPSFTSDNLQYKPENVYMPDLKALASNAPKKRNQLVILFCLNLPSAHSQEEDCCGWNFKNESRFQNRR